MKKLILLFSTVMAITAKAQIPNNGFETWTTTGSYQEPTGWATMNPGSAGPFYPCTISTDHYPVSIGNYSMRLENNTSLTQMTGGWGIAITDTFAYPFQPAFPISGHPNSLTGYYKFNSVNNDSMFIRIILFQSGIIVASPSFITGIPSSAWTSFTLPLIYSTADSATIFMAPFYPNGPTSGPKGNSVLNVDNLNFDFLLSSVFEQSSKVPSFTLYPNPASDVVNLDFDKTYKSGHTINIYNAIGELIYSEPLKVNQQQINTSALNNGIYMMEIRSEVGFERQKFVIQK